MKNVPSTRPAVKRYSFPAAVSAPSVQLKPTMISSNPVRLCGRCERATRPLATKASSIGTARSSTASLSLVWSLVATMRIAAPAHASASVQTPRMERVVTPGALPVSPRELALRDEAARTAAADEVAELRDVAARGHDDLRAPAVRAEPPGDLEAVHVGQLDVEQDDVRTEPGDGLERRGAVLGLADHLVPLGLEELPRGGAEAGVVVDDQDTGHGRMVARGGSRRHTGSRTLVPWTCRPAWRPGSGPTS